MKTEYKNKIFVYVCNINLGIRTCYINMKGLTNEKEESLYRRYH